MLVVEDDEGIANALVRALTSQGYDVEHAPTGAKARASVRDRFPDLVLLDLGLPDMDGLDVCRALIEEHPSIRVLVLTARAEEIDVVLGLDAGAVDYVTKPFRLAELLARLRAHLRTTVAAPEPENQTRVDGLLVDRSARRVWLDDVELDLRVKEFDLLAELVSHAGTVVSREDLMTRVWDEHWFGSTKTLDVHMASLRRKLGDRTVANDVSDASTERISTIRGVGYRLNVGQQP